MTAHPATWQAAYTWGIASWREAFLAEAMMLRHLVELFGIAVIAVATGNGG
jgi:hypothetical protein